MTEAFKKKLEAFRLLVEIEQLARIKVQYPNTYENKESLYRDHGVSVIPGRKYVKVDIGTGGRYMVEIETGIIRFVKAYGVPNMLPIHQHGTLDTIDNYYWGDYEAVSKCKTR